MGPMNAPGWSADGGPRQDPVPQDYSAAAAVRAALPDVLGEDEELGLLRAEFGDRYSITVCDGIWEARPREKMRTDEAITAKAAAYLAWGILRRERAAH